jgi:hypothetical protein
VVYDKCENLQIDRRTKWWKRGAQEGKKTIKGKKKRQKTLRCESLTTDNKFLNC